MITGAINEVFTKILQKMCIRDSYMVITYKTAMGISYIKLQISSMQVGTVLNWKKLLEYEKNNM